MRLHMHDADVQTDLILLLAFQFFSQLCPEAIILSK